MSDPDKVVVTGMHHNLVFPKELETSDSLEPQMVHTILGITVGQIAALGDGTYGCVLYKPVCTPYPWNGSFPDLADAKFEMTREYNERLVRTGGDRI